MTETLDRPADSAAAEVQWYDSAPDMLASRLPDAVKGYGFAKPKGVAPLDNDTEILDRSFKAATALRSSVQRSQRDPQQVMKGLNPAFMQQFGMFTAAMGAPGFGAGAGGGMAEFMQQTQNALGELGKNITIGSGPMYSSSFGTAGFVPYDLVNPARLVYPVEN